MKNAKTVFNGFHKIVEFDAELKGNTVKRELLVMKSGVAGIVIDENNCIGLVSQYRPTVQRQTLELPAGVLDKENLSTVEILVEELMEECEIPKEEIISIKENPIKPYHMMIGNTDAKISFFKIRVKAQENKKVNDVDVDEVVWVTLEQMKEFIDNGAICDSKTTMTYYYLLSRQ